jgi:hypothetical protein
MILRWETCQELILLICRPFSSVLYLREPPTIAPQNPRKHQRDSCFGLPHLVYPITSVFWVVDPETWRAQAHSDTHNPAVLNTRLARS